MAKLSITRSCGHCERIQLFGKSEERTRRIKWLESHPCMECQLHADLTWANAVSLREGWPDLDGSPLQIVWAKVIRAKGVALAREFLQGTRTLAKASGIPEVEVDCAIDQYEVLIDSLIGQTSASWWIKHRNLSGRALLKAVAPNEWYEPPDPLGG